MPSPFQGMDPFIESRGLWEDFHHELISEIKSAAARVLPDKYVARSGERYYVVLASRDDLEPKKHIAQADVGVTQAPEFAATAGPLASASSTTAVAEEDEAVTMHALVETEYREAFVEIYAYEPERKLVTTIEVLSPSNKRYNSVGWQQYLRKRQAHFERYANLVEIDLLRGGQRMPMEDQWPGSPYYVLTCWKKRAPICKVWPAYVDRPLPKLRVPLCPPDEDLVLDLQPMVDAIYERSRYARDIDYLKPCQPPLDEAAMEYLKSRLAERKG